MQHSREPYESSISKYTVISKRSQHFYDTQKVRCSPIHQQYLVHLMWICLWPLPSDKKSTTVNSISSWKPVIFYSTMIILRCPVTWIYQSCHIVLNNVTIPSTKIKIRSTSFLKTVYKNIHQFTTLVEGQIIKKRSMNLQRKTLQTGISVVESYITCTKLSWYC